VTLGVTIKKKASQMIFSGENNFGNDKNTYKLTLVKGRVMRILDGRNTD
jgi:hypothetical protein